MAGAPGSTLGDSGAALAISEGVGDGKAAMSSNRLSLEVAVASPAAESAGRRRCSGTLFLG